MSDFVTRGLSVPAYGDGPGYPAANSRGESLIANALPSRTELVRLGNSWDMQIPTGSAYTNVADMPTTRAELALYNGEPSTGLSYVIDQIWFLSLTSVTAAAGVTLIAQLQAAVAAL